MDVEAEYSRIKKVVEELNKEATRNQALLDNAMQELAEEFDSHSVTEAENVRDEIQKEIEKLERRFAKTLKELEKACESESD